MTGIEKSFWIYLKEYALITLGVMFYAFAWALFLVPNNFVGGGSTGISSIIQYATNGLIPLGYSYLVINFILLVIAFFTLGKSFGGKTIYAIVLASICLKIFPGLIPQEFIEQFVYANGKLMSVIMGGIVVGIGIGISISQGGSTGGTDIVALIINKYRNISPGRMILIMDVVIIVSSLLVPSYSAKGELIPFMDKVTTVVYGLLLITISTNVLDLYLSGTKQSVQLFVLSKKYAEIADVITLTLHRGVTVMDATGWYTKKESKVLMVFTRKTDLNLLLKYIKMVDPEAFLSVASVTGVYGRGFDTIKLPKTKEKKTDK